MYLLFSSHFYHLVALFLISHKWSGYLSTVWKLLKFTLTILSQKLRETNQVTVTLHYKLISRIFSQVRVNFLFVHTVFSKSQGPFYNIRNHTPKDPHGLKWSKTTDIQYLQFYKVALLSYMGERKIMSKSNLEAIFRKIYRKLIANKHLTLTPYIT